MSSRLETRISEEKAAAGAYRRAFQAGMDACKDEMQHIGNRQSHLEGSMDASQRNSTPSACLGWMRRPISAVLNCIGYRILRIAWSSM